MRTLLLVPVLAGALLTGCKQASSYENDAGHAEAALLLDGRQHDHFGMGARDGDVITVEELLADPARYDGKEVRVTGSIRAVCKAAGCWARMGPSSELFIRMKDHAFFLPLDCEGRPAVMEGQVNIEETSVDELRHYAEDAGKSAEEIARITAPKREVVLTAAGVALEKGGE